MFGQEELDRLAQRKQVLLLEGELNRLALQADLNVLRTTAAWVNKATEVPRKLGPLLLLAPLAGFLLARGSRTSESWFGRAVAAARWVGPLYTLWKRFAAARREAEPAGPAA